MDNQIEASRIKTGLYVHAVLLPHQQNGFCKWAKLYLEVIKHEVSSDTRSEVESGQDAVSLAQKDVLICYTLMLSGMNVYEHRLHDIEQADHEVPLESLGVEKVFEEVFNVAGGKYISPWGGVPV